jgi:hypothetical protein
MNRLIILSFLLFLPILTSTSASGSVYICNNGRTAVFHTDDGCPALNRCTAQRLEVSISQAKSRGLRVCQYRSGCDGQE